MSSESIYFTLAEEMCSETYLLRSHDIRPCSYPFLMFLIPHNLITLRHHYPQMPFKLPFMVFLGSSVSFYSDKHFYMFVLCLQLLRISIKVRIALLFNALKGFQLFQSNNYYYFIYSLMLQFFFNLFFV